MLSGVWPETLTYMYLEHWIKTLVHKKELNCITVIISNEICDRGKIPHFWSMQKNVLQTFILLDMNVK